MTDISGNKRERYEDNLHGEIDSASLYHALAEAETDERLAEVYRRLAAVEESHAEYWKKQLTRLGARIPTLKPGFRARGLAFLAQRFGPGFVLPVVNTLEQVDSGAYDQQAEAVAAGLPQEERSHARILSAITSTSEGLPGTSIARIEGRHRAMGGNSLRAAVLGANDGLVSNLSLVMGVAGANVASGSILLTGLAGLVAGACSMAMGEWLSVNSSRELYQKQIATEAMELQEVPDEEREELELIYEAKGLPAEQAKALAARLLADKATALDTLVREELGIDPQDLGGSAWGAAGASFLLFTFGAIFPVVGYFFLSGNAALWTSLGLSGLALMAIGAGTSLFTGRGVVFSALRQLLFGLSAAGVTYGIGALVGVGLSG
ncbi:VIT1/CCC1 transporter family protein [Marinobacter sp. ANT_B65]|uniref:VIT1/CCC1 transporter family protein n=1 Tax=Marinobacter sp. ANT_B65 TaxID=2039467 RepID=UPI000BBEEC96|nr:VIT1/CCC1 family protein [Marinobacter sp. ANT_B65]PCM46429.1 rubrerythrin family protein [Marinobacter sp. ANT_B65]